MTLGRQLAYAISVIFLAALVGVQAIHLRSAQVHLQQRTADPQLTGELADVGALGPQGRDDPQPVRVAEGAQLPQELVARRPHAKKS